MRYGTTFISGTIFLLALGTIIFTASFAAGESEAHAAAFEFAYLYLGLLGLCSFGTAVAGLAEARVITAVPMPGKNFYIFLALCFAYLLTLTYVGSYFPVTVISLCAAILLLGGKPVTAFAVSVGFSGLMYGVFSGFLNVPLP